MSETEYVVAHEETNSRYVITIDDKVAGYADYVVVGHNDDIRDFNHTVVEPEHRGKGLSKPLIRHALDDSREEGFKVRPSCSAVENFINANSEYADMVAP